MFDPENIITLYFTCDDTLTQADVDQLSEWIEQSHENALKFIQASFMHRAIYDSLVGVDIKKNILLDLNEATNSGYEVVMDSNVSLEGVDVTKLDEKKETVAGSQGSLNSKFMQILQEIANSEANAPTVHIEKPVEEPADPPVIKPARPERKMSKFSVFTLMLSSAAVLLFVAMVFFMPIHPMVATLTDSIDAEWVDMKDIPVNGDPLSQGEMTLAKGFAEITFKDGAVVIIEAPAIIELESPKSMFLASGRISAVVSEYATGFTVNALGASIVDLGTEFGVSVEDNGSCSLSMFKGLANLIVGQKGQKRKTQRVNANEAKSVDLAGVVVDIKLDEKRFVRQIDSARGLIWRGQKFMNLADIVGGGNGFGGGVLGSGLDVPEENLEGGVSGNNYKLIDTHEFIDGVFVPNGRTQVSSEGHVFQGCPRTDGYRYVKMCYGLSEAAGEGEELMVMEGEDYSTVEKPGLSIHSNQGITFNLQKIRNSLVGVDVVEFKGVFGIGDREGYEERSTVEFFVVVDGKQKFHRAFIEQDGSVNLSVKLSPKDRFLTFITTDGGDGFTYDWAVLAEPVLVLDIDN